MTPRQLTDTYHVSPQISLEDVAAAREAGFKTIICNRPDGENPPALHAAEMRKAVEAEGLTFLELPFDHSSMTMDIVAQQAAMIESAEGPILAYCASGNRCTIVWALGQAQKGARGPEELVATAAEAGYDLRGLMPTLQSLSASA